MIYYYTYNSHHKWAIPEKNQTGVVGSVASGHTFLKNPIVFHFFT